MREENISLKYFLASLLSWTSGDELLCATSDIFFHLLL